MKDGDTSSSRPVLTVPTSSWKPGDAARLAELAGTVQGGPGPGAGECRVWVERESGEIVPVVWPAGFRARLNPLELLDGTDAVVAVTGTRIGVAGGLMPVDPGDPGTLGQSDAFYVMDELPPLRPPS